ncbi:hypothetical protein GIB67_031388 [Kingdonia uniflora]|uniref:Uncharacterized protein n=1 Tax=Kingdonia uniflora TaxID=39325 RepID=A0A7J7MAZ7_9MAGN|nr:hypothetical protein GIB67_031388 [Kingdonia uniflora]
MASYNWPCSLIKEGDNILLNYIWIEDSKKGKGVTLKWEKVRKPINEGGLGVRSLGEVNNVMLCKLHWVFKQRSEDWALFLKSKFSTKSEGTICYHKPSTIWSGIKIGAALTKPSICWLIGDGKKIDFWRETWAIEITLMEYIELPVHMWKLYTAKLNNFIKTQGWQFPNDIRLLLRALGIHVQQLQCNPNNQDTMIWKPDLRGAFSRKNAFKTLHKGEDTTWWWKYVWNNAIHPRQGGFALRLLNHLLPMDDTIMKKGNPGNVGIGIIYKDNKGDVMGTYGKATGHATNYIAEITTIISGVQ